MNLNAKRDEVQSLRDRVAGDLGKIRGLCSEMSAEVNRLFLEEVSRANGDTSGLDDYQSLSRSLKKDAAVVQGALSIVSGRLQGARGYDFEDMLEGDK